MTRRRTRLLLWGGVLGPVIFIAVFLLEGALRPEYDPVRLPVSLLSLTDRGWVQTLSFLVSGVMLVGCSIGIRGGLRTGFGARGVPIAIGIAGIGLLGAGIFPTDPLLGYPSGAPMYPAGYSPAAYVHVVAAFALFLGLSAAPVLMAVRAARRGLRAWTAISMLCGVACVVLFGLSSTNPSAPESLLSVAGLLQRASLVVGLGWTCALAAGTLAGRAFATIDADGPGASSGG